MALMKISGYPANLVKLTGCVHEIIFSHESFGAKYYSATIETDNNQRFQLIIHHRIVALLDPHEGDHCMVFGVVRNYTSKYGKTDPARILVTAMLVDNERNYNVNTAEVTGVITMVNKRTDHYEFLVEALRIQGNYDLVPCAVWQPECGNLHEMVGKTVHLSGVLRERHFQFRPVEGGSEDRCIYELHIKKWERINEEITESHP